jgi:glutamyl-Q tRNA(Asp) synthetase
MYTGRFAPSPTGPLHFGSLVAALASWLDARAAGSRWLVRIEDLDRPREHPGAAGHILQTLQAFGLYWDGAPEYQSRRVHLYEAAAGRLQSRLYGCACSRREIADSSLGTGTDGAQIYPGTCRGGMQPGRSARAVRLRTEPGELCFDDRVQGRICQDVGKQVGDFVLRRADGLFAYQLAVVVDDAAQGVTDVVRGADLLDSTARQIYVQRLLGYPQPRYLHVPAAVNSDGDKLSKQTGALAIDASDKDRVLEQALRFLGQLPAQDLAQAVRNWDPARIPRCRTLAVP